MTPNTSIERTLEQWPELGEKAFLDGLRVFRTSLVELRQPCICCTTDGQTIFCAKATQAGDIVVDVAASPHPLILTPFTIRSMNVRSDSWEHGHPYCVVGHAHTTPPDRSRAATRAVGRGIYNTSTAGSKTSKHVARSQGRMGETDPAK